MYRRRRHQKMAMLYKLVVPGPADEEFRILEWHAAESAVHPAEQLLVEIETQKSIVEVRLREGRIVRKILTDVDAWQHFGEPIAVLCDTRDEALASDAVVDLLPVAADYIAV
jgi:pyruvate/2-oxoglutarate dehydrogenase complex dihydrolipoamide acyltransferase (E2) component